MASKYELVNLNSVETLTIIVNFPFQDNLLSIAFEKTLVEVRFPSW